MIKDYEAIKNNCGITQLNLDPELEEKPELESRDFPMTAMTVCHNCIYMHWHNSFEVILFHQGEGVCYIGGQKYFISAGDIAVIDGGRIHAAYSVNDTELKFTPVIFDRQVLLPYLMNAEHTRLLASFMEGKAVLPKVIQKDCEQYNSILSTIEGMKEEFAHKSPGYHLCIRAYLLILILKISAASGFEEKEEHNREYLTAYDFKKLFDYIKTSYQEKITLNQAAGMVNLSINHFCKIFKEMTGLTFINFLNLHRVNAAEELLRNSGLSITEITEKTGFCNLNYFCRIFKQFKGYPPSKCRKHITE